MSQANPSRSLHHVGLALLWFLGFVVVTVALGYIPISWENWAPATCMPKHCFCESLHTGTIRQPANTYSNLGFVLVGLPIVSMLRRNRSLKDSGRPAKNNLINNVPLYTIVYGWAVVLVGLFSMFYHASMTFVGQWFDVMAMYLLATFIVLYNMARTFRWTGQRFLSLYLASNVILGFFLAYVPLVRRQLFGGLIALVLVTEVYDQIKRKPSINRWLLGAAALSLGLAFTIWILDIKHIWCSQNSLIQGHAFWHLLCAVSGGFVYLYYRSEDDNRTLT